MADAEKNSSSLGYPLYTLACSSRHKDAGVRGTKHLFISRGDEVLRLSAQLVLSQSVCACCRTQYDELEEEEDEAMKRRTMALSSADALPQLPVRAASASHKVLSLLPSSLIMACLFGVHALTRPFFLSLDGHTSMPKIRMLHICCMAACISFCSG